MITWERGGERADRSEGNPKTEKGERKCSVQSHFLYFSFPSRSGSKSKPEWRERDGKTPLNYNITSPDLRWVEGEGRNVTAAKRERKEPLPPTFSAFLSFARKRVPARKGGERGGGGTKTPPFARKREKREKKEGGGKGKSTTQFFVP